MSKKGCLKWIAGIAALMLILMVSIYFVFNQEEPQGKKSAEADVMAEKILEAINKPAWDSLAFISWSFPGGHHYFWDKTRHLVEVKWDNNRVLLNPNLISGVAYEGDKKLKSDEEDKMIKKAWSFFCNDSFWLNAPAKVFDPGTERSIVEIDGKKGLKVEYVSGGVTPGDSYVWFVGEDGLPSSYKMWVKIIPIGGMEFTWEEWRALPGGAKIATTHKSSGPTLVLDNIRTGRTFRDFDLDSDPFEDLIR